MRTLALVFAIVSIAPPVFAEENGAAEARIIAVKFHADWCGSCKAMGTAFTDLENKLDGQPVLFVELDLTNRTTARQASYMINALGAPEIWNEFGGKTGFILLLDENRSVVGKLDSKMTFKEMVAEIERALDAS